jgi:hypothetical protein
MIAAEPFIDRWLDEGALAPFFAKAPIHPEFFVELAGLVLVLLIAFALKQWRVDESSVAG